MRRRALTRGRLAPAMQALVVLLAIGVLALLLLGVPATRDRLAERLPTRWRIDIAAWRHNITVDHGVTIAMPDRTQLTASLYRPKNSGEALPTVLIQLPYHRLRFGGGYRSALFFAQHGYAVLVQDVRGTGDSQGEFFPWRDAAKDGTATLDWIARQVWANGKVGTFGCSALGETQLILAAQSHPAHRAMIPSGAGGAVGTAAGRYSYFGLYEGGVFQLASGFGWFVRNGGKRADAAPARDFSLAQQLQSLPIAEMVRQVRPAANGYDEFMTTALSDPKWRDWGYLSDADRPKVPALVINTWGDQTVGDTLAFAQALRDSDPKASANQKLLIGPGDHCAHPDWTQQLTRHGELAIASAQRPLEQWYLRWFDYWLKGGLKDVGAEPLAELQAFNYFMLGENRWLASDHWPPAEASTQRWYLGSGGRANSRIGNGLLAPAPASSASGERSNSNTVASDTFTYDPINPVPSRGGPVCCTGNPNEQSGPADQADVESRDDVLVYTSTPLREDLRIAGPLKAQITVSSSAADTDLVARLVHVHPDGRAIGIQEGALRLRYRSGFAIPTLMTPGRRYTVQIDMRSIAYRIPKGHRLRLDLTSSSFPRLERNLNTGAANNATETASVVATNRVYYDEPGGSFMQLPLLLVEP